MPEIYISICNNTFCLVEFKSMTPVKCFVSEIFSYSEEFLGQLLFVNFSKSFCRQAGCMGSQNELFCFFLIPFISPAFAAPNSFFMCFFYCFYYFFIGKFCFFIYEECILHFSDRVVLCSKKSVEIPERAGYHIARHLFESHFCPYFSCII